MTRVMQAETALARFCYEYYGTIKTASEILEVPYQTLCNNCRRPARGWKYVNKMVDRFMTENRILKDKIAFLNEQYTHLASEYNMIVKQLEESGDTGERL